MAKVAHLKKYIEQTSEPDEQIVLFCIFTDTIVELEKALGGGRRVAVIHGGVPQKRRHEEIEAFQAGEKRFFIGQVVAAGPGITLTASSRMIFVDIDWTPANMEQAEDRIHRIGQENSCIIEYMVFAGSYDHKIVTSLTEKTEARKAIRGE